jgi:Undecaprenyl-phosphate glucose phosphotransferase
MKSTETELKFLYLALDLIVLNIAIALFNLLVPALGGLNMHDNSIYLLHANMSEILTYSVLSRKDVYLHDDFSNRVKRITKRMGIFIIVLFVLAELFLPRNYSFIFLLGYTAFFFVGKIIFYFFLYEYLKFRRTRGYYIHKVLILGYNEMGILLSEVLNNNPLLGYDCVGFISENKIENESVLGNLNDLATLTKEHEIDMVFVTLPKYNDLNNSKELLALCNKIGVRLRFVPENQYWFKARMSIESVGSFVVFNPQEIPLDHVKYRFIKRTFDVIFSSLVIVFIISWLFPIIFILIKLTSKGPVFFIQQRTGINNKTFKCLKFRSMTVNKDADSKQATIGDARITPIGRFLRKSNIDEFPQFFNVLFGQMSIVGPRPHMLKHTEQYSELIDHYKVRHYVKPGITGWAQVNGYRGETDQLWKMEKRVEYDMHYLKHWNFFWDVKIVFLTVLGKNALKNAG